MVYTMDGKLQSENSSIRTISISNQNRTKWLTNMPVLGWTDNPHLALVFESERDAVCFEESEEIREFLENELEELVWSNTFETIYQ
nr:hypothetical protein [uncultured Bacteroides sp.]